MLTPEQIHGLQVMFERLADPLTDYIVQDVARRVKEAAQLTSTAAHQIWRAQTLGRSRRQVERAVADILHKTVPEVRELFKQAAEVGYTFDIQHLPRRAVAFAQNSSVQQIMSAAIKLAGEDLQNLTQTLGFMTPDGVVSPLLTAYQKTTDFAFTKVLTGAADYNTAIRQACTRLAADGIRTIDYASGVHTTLEAAIRRNMMGGLGLMVEEISQQTYQDLGCSGWEISAHGACAPDHEPIQGKQYTDAEYQALNRSLRRRIGTLNCGHAAFPIILGVNGPLHTPRELEAFREDNAQGVAYEGSRYSVYEATQMQRKLERAIRAQKRRVLLADETGDKERILTTRGKLQRLRQEYKRFSKATGLPTQDERVYLAGFGRS